MNEMNFPIMPMPNNGGANMGGALANNLYGDITIIQHRSFSDNGMMGGYQQMQMQMQQQMLQQSMVMERQARMIENVVEAIASGVSGRLALSNQQPTQLNAIEENKTNNSKIFSIANDDDVCDQISFEIVSDDCENENNTDDVKPDVLSAEPTTENIASKYELVLRESDLPGTADKDTMFLYTRMIANRKDVVINLIEQKEKNIAPIIYGTKDTLVSHIYIGSKKANVWRKKLKQGIREASSAIFNGIEEQQYMLFIYNTGNFAKPDECIFLYKMELDKFITTVADNKTASVKLFNETFYNKALTCAIKYAKIEEDGRQFPVKFIIEPIIPSHLISDELAKSGKHPILYIGDSEADSFGNIDRYSVFTNAELTYNIGFSTAINTCNDFIIGGR